MIIHTSESEVAVAFPLIGVDGSALQPLSVAYRVTDQDDQEVQALTSVYEASTPEAPQPLDVVKVVIHPTQNKVADGRVREMRRVELQVTTATGVVKFSSEYIVEVSEVLTVNVNSFQNYAHAVLLGCDIPNLLGWNAAPKRERIVALIQARENVSRLSFRYRFDNAQDFLIGSQFIRDLTQLTASEWRALPEEFRRCLCRAQVIEADAVLGGDEVGEMRAAGIISKTTGESKAFFRANNKPIDRAVCSRAMKELSRYLDMTLRIGRG